MMLVEMTQSRDCGKDEVLDSLAVGRKTADGDTEIVLFVKLKAGVAWYGRLVGEAQPNMPHFPVEGAAALKRHAEERHRALFRHAPLPIALATTTGRLRDANSAFSRLPV